VIKQGFSFGEGSFYAPVFSLQSNCFRTSGKDRFRQTGAFCILMIMSASSLVDVYWQQDYFEHNPWK
jgi:hypothetical protein